MHTAMLKALRNRAAGSLALLMFAAAAPVICHGGMDVSYVTGSSQKLQQFIGDTDFQTGQPTLSQSGTLYNLENTDLGVSFRFNDQTFMLFGDSDYPGTKDAYGYTSDTDPQSGLTLTFFSTGTNFTPVYIANIPLTGFDVPIYGIGISNNLYLYYATDSDPSIPMMGRTVVVVSTNGGAAFSSVLYTLSSNLFINVSVIEVNCADWPGLPQTNGLGLLIFGSGPYRQSDIYLAFQPEAGITNPATISYMTGLDTNKNPTWSGIETNAAPLAAITITNTDGSITGVGELSAMFNVFLGKWMLLYNFTDEIQFRTADKPWGPYPGYGVSFNPTLDNGFTNFIYYAGANDLNLCNPNVSGHNTSNSGGVYGPYVFNGFTLGSASQTNIQTTVFHSLSTWNPYNSVLMQTEFTRRPPPVIYAGNPLTNVLTPAGPGGAGAYVQSGTNANLNFGADTTLIAKNSGANLGSVTRKIYLRFPVNLPPGQRVTQASLTMTEGSVPNATVPLTYNVYGLRFASAGQNWSQTNISWNNAPANLTNDPVLVDLNQAIFLGSFRTDTNRQIGSEYVLSSMVLVNFLNQATNAPVTFIITRLSVNSQVESFASVSNTKPPPALTYVALPNLPDQLVPANSASPPLPFSVNSAATNASSLTLTVKSSNSTLLPVTNVVIGGSGYNRTATLTPVVGQTGTTTVSLVVSDGIATTSVMPFGVTVATVPTLTLTGKTGSSFAVNGTVGPIYLIQSSIDLKNWNTLLTTNPVSLPFVFSDTNSPASQAKFYRTVVEAE